MSNYPANSKKRGVHLCILSLIAISLFSFPATVSAQVTISSLSPVSGAAGTDVTITGTNFSTTAANNIVYFSGVKASVTAATSTSLTVTVPKGAANGPVTVTTAGLTAYSSQFFLPTASQTKQILVQADLSLQSDISLTTRTYGMISGDLNGDGKPDLVVTDNGFTSTLSNTLTVLPNSTAADGGTISFGTATNYTVAGYNSLGIPALGDFDGDGKLDIASPASNTNTSSSSLFILRNTGDVTALVRSSAFTISYQATATAVADIDGDGKPDVATTGYNSSNVISVLRNTSSGTGNINFAGEVTFNTATADIYLQLADIDGDGKPDLLSSNGNSSGIQVRLNTSTSGNISFNPAITISTSSHPSYIAIADIDGDGKLDMAVATSTANAEVFLNTSSTGSISFSSTTISVSVGQNQQSIALCDLNGDGKPELVTTNEGSDDQKRMSVFTNTSSSGSISFNQTEILNYTGSVNAASGYAHALVAADFNNDGYTDVLAGYTNFAKIRPYAGSLQFPPAISSFSPVSAAPGSSVTLTGTGFNTTTTNNIVYFGGIKATVTAASTTSLTVTVPTGAVQSPITVLNSANHLSGAGRKLFLPIFTPSKTTLAATDFTAQTTIAAAGTSLHGVISGDLNNDGKTDLITTDPDGKALRIYPNNSSIGNISFGTAVVTDLTATGSPMYPATGDMDADGLPDIVVPNKTGNSFFVLRNNGSLSFTASSSFTAGTAPFAVAVGDLDGDGRPDVVTADEGSNMMHVFRNTSNATGSISFDAPYGINSINAPTYLQVVDMNLDGKPDILVSQSNRNSVSVLYNGSTPGSLAFIENRNDLTDGTSRPWGVSAADIDGDGMPDILAPNTTGNSINIFRNTGIAGGTLLFASPLTFDVGKHSQLITTGDLNGDGKPDVLVSTIETYASGTDYRVTVLPNTSSSGTILFGDAVTLSAGNYPFAGVLADFDGDKLPDIAVGNSVDKNTSIYRNTLITIPVTQASGLTVTSLTGTTATFSWTNGSGAKTAFFVKAASSGTPATVNGTDYTANTVFGSGSQIGSSGWYCVYNGTGSTVTVSGLTASTTYQAMATSFNDNNLTGVAQYQTATATGNPAGFTALATLNAISAATGSPTNSGTVNYTISLGSAVSGLSPANFNVTATGSVTGMSVTSVTGSGTSFTATVNTGSGDGTITLQLANITGISPALTNTLPFTGDSYTIDKTVPTLSSVTITSNNTNTAKAKTGDQVTISFTSSETITAPTVTMAGHTVTATNTSANNWTANYTMAASDAEGAVAFSIAFTDQSGNAGTTVTATTNSSSVTFDKTAPTLSTVTIASNNSNTAMAKTGDQVTISFTSSETITAPTVTMAGHTVTATNTSANNWTASYTMAASDAEGTVAFSIAFTDQTGNAGTTVTATTNSSSVTFDKTVPTLSTVTIASNNSNTAVAKTGDQVTIGFTSSETIATPAVSIAGHTVTATNTSANNWTANYTMAASDAEGIVAFSIAFTDQTGNAGTTVTATTNSSSVTFDKTVPTLSTVTIASNNSNTAVAKVGDMITLSFTASETIATPAVSIAGHTVTATNTSANNWTASYTMAASDAEGAVAFSIAFTDQSGNAGTTVTATTNSSSVTFDKTIPTLSTVTIASNNSNTAKAKTGDAITLNFTASETIATPAVSIAGHTVTATNTSANNWTANYTMAASDAEGTVAFSIAFTDQSGNAGTTVTATTNSSSVTFDKTAPTLSTVTITSNNSNTAVAKVGDVITLSFTASETIATPAVSIAGHTVTATNTSANNWTASYTMAASDAEGAVAFSIAFTDQTGNAGTTVTATTNSSSVTFDKTVPTLSTVTITSNNSNTAVAKVGDVITLSFTASETIATPAVSIAGHTVTATNTSANNWTANYTLAASDAEGTVAFSIAFNDQTGNAGTTITATTNSSSVTFDKTIPTLSTVTIASNNSNTAVAKTGDAITLSFTASEAIATPTVTIAGHTVTATNTSANNWTASYTMAASDAEGTVAFSIAFTDQTGNAGTTVSATTNSSSVVFNKTTATLSTVTITSNNSNTAKAKTGDVVTISFTASETIATPAVSIAGHTVTATNTSANNWTANYTMAASDAEGAVAFSIAFTDQTGNAGTTVTATTNSSSVTFDKTVPTLSSVTIASNNSNTAKAKTGDVITLSFTASEAIATPAVSIAGHTVTATNTSANNWTANYTMAASDAEGTVAFSIAFTDQTGNAGTTVTATTNSSSVTFDKTIPTLSSVTIASNNSNTAVAKTGDQVTISFTASETIATPAVSIAGHTVTATNTSANNWTANYTMAASDAEGTVAFSIAFTDQTGNAGTTVTTTTNSSSVVFTKKSGNTAPLFAAGTNATLTVCMNDNNTGISNLLAAADADQGQTLSWSVVTAPVNGTLSGFTTSSISNGSVLIPAGLSYKPLPGFSGTDACVVQVSDGIANTTLTLTITVNGVNGTITAPQGAELCALSSPLPLTASGGASYAWFRNGSLISGSGTQQLVTAIGVYSVQVTTAAGCTAAARNTITVTMGQPAMAPVRMNPVNISQDQPTRVQARTFGQQYSWLPVTGLDNPTSPTPSANLHSDQEYLINIYTAAGCLTVDTLAVRVYPAHIYVAKGFTPNGDGVNDLFMPTLVNVIELRYFRIFNRTGKKVFETNQLNTGWDGRVGGKLQPVDTYIWEISVIGTDGRFEVKSGSVTLLR